MCGRVRRVTSIAEIKLAIGFPDRAALPNMPASWNVPPTADLPVVVLDKDGQRRPVVMKWGMISPWAPEPKMKYATFNAKAETIETTKTFKGPWEARRRCLVITDGFYEWRKSDKQPFAVNDAGSGLMVMAGLWEGWRSKDGSETVRSCTIITCPSNDAMSQLHDRMPVILDPTDWPAWLGETERVDLSDVKALLRPCDPERLKIWPVSKKVGSVSNDGRELIEPIELAA